MNRSQLQDRAMKGAEPWGGFQKIHGVLAGASRIRVGCASREGVLAYTPLPIVGYVPLLLRLSVFTIKSIGLKIELY